jgi:DNA polymerase delta subunit 1
VHYSIITDLQNGSAETRRRLAVYCLKDATLPQKLLDKLMLLINNIEMARVTGVPISYLLTRGQQIKVISQLYRKAKTKDMVIPVLNHTVSEETYEGATVFEPRKGYYTTPISTLDFSSLYPSIMMAHNLCYTTLISPQTASSLSETDYTKTPAGHFFVKPSLQQGILPEILIELLQARKKAKSDMKNAPDEFTKAVLNGRQLALKISANSVYGFTGANVGQLPCLEISSSVTAFGRIMIDDTRKLIEKHFSISNGYKFNSTVIYGDTDSVMINFGVESVQEAMELGKEASKTVTAHFADPIRLEFEKVYFPYLLMNKKRYAGLCWTDSSNWSKLDAKGIETVRRDNCPLVKTVVETCLEKILIQRSVEDAIEYVKGVISDLLCNRMDLSQLVISKALSKAADSEEYVAKTAHGELAKKMQKRDPGNAPNVGDRVAYVITKGSKGAKAFEKAEDPIYVLEHDIPIDTNYYLENQLKQPLTRLFEPILGDARKILEGEHTRSVKIQTSSLGIMRFAKKTATCIGCKVPLKSENQVVCKHCEGKVSELYLNELTKQRANEKLHAQLWTQCQRCQDNFCQDVICSKYVSFLLFILTNFV